MAQIAGKKKRFIRGLYNWKPEFKGCVATIGSFDGVHRGHCEILSQLKEQSERFQLPSVVMFFEPQPREYFSAEQSPARLMRLRDKFEALMDEGVDRVFCLPFNSMLRNLSAEQFIDQVLIEAMGIQSLVVGDDFRFGNGRTGNYQMLQQAAIDNGFSVTDTRTVSYQSNRISSTRVRQALEADDFALAAELLGRAFTVNGRVAHGQKLGSRLGIPTANVALQRYAAPIRGVFATEVRLPDGRVERGVANVGLRPTVGDCVKPILEVHLLDFNQNIYGQRISVRPLKKLREEKKFDSLDSLVEAIKGDIEQAKKYFSA